MELSAIKNQVCKVETFSSYISLKKKNTHKKVHIMLCDSHSLIADIFVHEQKVKTLKLYLKPAGFYLYNLKPFKNRKPVIMYSNEKANRPRSVSTELTGSLCEESGVKSDGPQRFSCGNGVPCPGYLRKAPGGQGDSFLTNSGGTQGMTTRYSQYLIF